MLSKNHKPLVSYPSDTSGMSRVATVPNFSFNYNPEERIATFALPEGVLSGGFPFFAIDTNTSFDEIDWYKKEDNIFTFTSGTIVQESPQGILASKADLVCGSDLYETTTDRWEEPISIKILDSGTNQVYEELLIKLSKSTSHSGFSSWVFTGITSDGTSTTMLIKDGALNFNSDGKRGDLSLLAIIFIFKTATLNVGSLSNDKNDIADSLATFKLHEVNR